MVLGEGLCNYTVARYDVIKCRKMAEEQFDSYKDGREGPPSYRHGTEDDR